MNTAEAGTGWLQAGCHPSWEPLLDEGARLSLAGIEKAVGPHCLPVSGAVLRFLQTDVGRLRIVILGQDPYPSPGAATGRAFEVGGLESWSEPFRQVSLKNIIRLIWCADHGIRPCDGDADYNRIPLFSQIRSELQANLFPLAAPGRLFRSWEEQGVLLLNTSLTVPAGSPGAHREAWQPFTRRVLGFLSTLRPDLAWFLWGGQAQAHAPLLGMARTFPSRHPMLCSSSFPDDFFRNPCFHETSGLVDWMGTHHAGTSSAVTPSAGTSSAVPPSEGTTAIVRPRVP
jgi:uracil-DNA glycosylase